MDADFSHSPADIPRMLEPIGRYDVVVGSRYVKGGRTEERWGWGRWFLSWWANSVWVRLALGVRTKDATAGFKCWRASALRRMDLEPHSLERLHLPGGDVLRGGKMGLRILRDPHLLRRPPRWSEQDVECA